MQWTAHRRLLRPCRCFCIRAIYEHIRGPCGQTLPSVASRDAVNAAWRRNRQYGAALARHAGAAHARLPLDVPAHIAMMHTGSDELTCTGSDATASMDGVSMPAGICYRSTRALPHIKGPSGQAALDRVSTDFIHAAWRPMKPSRDAVASGESHRTQCSRKIHVKTLARAGHVRLPLAVPGHLHAD